MSKSSVFITRTFGVVILTGWPSSSDTDVAEEPRLILRISPIASISMPERVSASFDPNEITFFQIKFY